MARSMTMSVVMLSLCAFLHITASQEVHVVGVNLGETINMFGPCPTLRVSFNYTIGDPLGWTMPPSGQIFYDTWASTRTFKVGDALVFLFINGTQDVAVVSNETYKNCETRNTIAVYSGSLTKIVLKSAGEHFFTSTYGGHCALGQKLAINVTSNTSSSSSSPSSSPSLSTEVAKPSTIGLALESSASRVVSRCIATFFFIFMSLFY